MLALALSPKPELTGWSPLAVLLLGLICVAIEAISLHGWDNTPMQVIPTFLATVLF